MHTLQDYDLFLGQPAERLESHYQIQGSVCKKIPLILDTEE